MYSTTLTDLERVARLEIQHRTSTARGRRLRRSLRTGHGRRRHGHTAAR